MHCIVCSKWELILMLRKNGNILQRQLGFGVKGYNEASEFYYNVINTKTIRIAAMVFNKCVAECSYTRNNVVFFGARIVNVFFITTRNSSIERTNQRIYRADQTTRYGKKRL